MVLLLFIPDPAGYTISLIQDRMPWASLAIWALLFYSETRTLQSKKLYYQNLSIYDLCYLFVSFSLLLMNYHYPPSVLCEKCCQGRYLDFSGKRDFNFACMSVYFPSSFWNMLPSPYNHITRKLPVTPSRIECSFVFHERTLQKIW